MKKYTKIKLVEGIGINDVDYSVYEYSVVDGKSIRIWSCPFYVKWRCMLRRCYSEKYLTNRPTYVGSTVCENWLSFSNFKNWMSSQDWEDKELDKDILIPRNKIYSPDTCVFVSQKVNSFLTESNSLRGKWPIGVYLDPKSGKFKSQCWSLVTGKRKNLGSFSSPEAAHLAWLSFKLEQARFLAEQQTDERVAKALVNRYENYSILFDVE